MARKRSKFFGQKRIHAVLSMYLVLTWTMVDTSLEAMPPECVMLRVSGYLRITVIVK